MGETVGALLGEALGLGVGTPSANARSTPTIRRTFMILTMASQMIPGKIAGQTHIDNLGVFFI